MHFDQPRYLWFDNYTHLKTTAMKKLILLAALFITGLSAAQAQRTVTDACITVNFAPLSPVHCTYTVDVSVETVDMSPIVLTQTLTFTSGSTGGTLCFSAPHGSQGFFPGTWKVHVYTPGGTNFTVTDAGLSSTPANMSFAGACSTTSNCSTSWLRLSTNTFTLRPGCAGGVD